MFSKEKQLVNRMKKQVKGTDRCQDKCQQMK